MQDPVEKRLTLGEHLEELRSRVGWSILFVLAGLIVCFALDSPGMDYPLMTVVLYPHRMAIEETPNADKQLVALKPAENFMNHLKVAFIGGLFLSAPFVLHQGWKFVAAGLYHGERKAVMTVFPLSLLLFLVGCAFGYTVLVPAALTFLMSYDPVNVHTMISLDEYLDFFFLLTLLTGASFELPLVMTFFARIGLVTAETYRKKWKLAILLSFVLGGFLTPSPDPFTQCLLAGPLYLLYEGGILMSKWAWKKPAEATP
ncbi:MAG: twin-arginine translocase subunit TatC [Planctomycetota bacterium]